MHEREKSVPTTYMGNFLAIPHGTNAAKDLIKRSAVSIVRYPEGIDWNGKQVKFVVGVAGVNNEHLSILSAIARVFSDKDQVAKLDEATSVDALIDQLASTPSYDVHEVGEEPAVKTVDNYRALNSRSQDEEVIAEIGCADIVTTAVGPNVLKFIAPAVDRIVPNQAAGQGLDVTVETFYEWVIDRTPFDGSAPDIPGATHVDDLAPYIERKLFTVNTVHAAAAYFGYAAGVEKIADAMADQGIAGRVRAVLEETKQLLISKHGSDVEEQEAYVQKILGRFTNQHLPDTLCAWAGRRCGN